MNSFFNNIMLILYRNIVPHVIVILRTGEHVDVGSIRNGKNVGRHFITPLAAVQFGAPRGIHGESFVRINSHAEQAGIGLQRSMII